MPKLKKIKALELSRVLKRRQALSIYKHVVPIRRDSLGNIENKELEHVFLEYLITVPWEKTDKWQKEKSNRG